MNKNNVILLLALAVFVVLMCVMVARIDLRLANTGKEILGLKQEVGQMRDLMSKIPMEQMFNHQSKLDGISQKLSHLSDMVAKDQAVLSVVMDSANIRDAAAAGRPVPEDFNKQHNIPVGDSPVQGEVDAPVTITGFLDLECPFSGHFQPVIDEVIAAYPGKVKYVVKNFPLSFHQRAKPAAKFLLAAGEQNKYWEMFTLILKDNKDLSDAKLNQIAKSLELDLNRIKEDLKKHDAEWDKLIWDDYNLGNKVEVAGTPTYYINGRKVKGRDLAAFKAVIEPILKGKKAPCKKQK